jgi:hypothetical protein
MDARKIHLVRVTTDDRSQQLWAAATQRAEAVDCVLDAIPEGWAACLLDQTLQPGKDIPAMFAGEVRKLPNGQSAPSGVV